MNWKETLYWISKIDNLFGWVGKYMLIIAFFIATAYASYRWHISVIKQAITETQNK